MVGVLIFAAFNMQEWKVSLIYQSEPFKENTGPIL